MSLTMLVVLGLCGMALAVVGVLALMAYGSRMVHQSMFQEDSHDHELSLSLARARRREADTGRPAGGAMPAVPAREPGPRDPVIGIDQARAEVRERIHCYNTREVRK
jgi:hypothetical protein